MIKYMSAALALKTLSSGPWARKFYRDCIGNYFGQKRRLKRNLQPAYLEKCKQMLDLCRDKALLKHGMHIAEIGTGWTHFYSVFIRLFYDVKITLVDVWDNRQLQALQNNVRHLDQIIDDVFSLNGSEKERVHRLLGQIAKCRSFDEIYALLDFNYVIDGSRVFDFVKNDSLDMVFSFDVLEHIYREQASDYARNIHRGLKKDGISLHQIGIDDHLTHYDKSASPKNYLRYSDRTWKLFFENELQYFNRIQPSEWKKIFEANHLKLVHDAYEMAAPHPLKVNKKFRSLPSDDIYCTRLTLVHKK